MISGLYLGEVVRLILVRMTKEKLLFQGKTSAKLLKTGSFSTSFIYGIDTDKYVTLGSPDSSFFLNICQYRVQYTLLVL